MTKVTLIGAELSLFCTRVEWALKLKNVNDYEYVQEDLKNKSPVLLKYNPVHKKVPVLVHGDELVAESLVILEYIDETWKHNALIPQDPHDRAMARFWAKFADDKCLVGAIGACHALGEEKKKAIEMVQESLSFLEKEIEGKKFFGGEEIGFLDLVVGWIPYFMDVMEEVGEMKILDEHKFPNLHRWAQDFIGVPLIKEMIPAREKVVQFVSDSLVYLRFLDAHSGHIQ